MCAQYSENLEPLAQATTWARRLVDGEQSRHGLPVRVAASRVARRVKSSTSAVMALIYAPPKDVGARLFAALRLAVESELRTEIEALQHELDQVRRDGARDRHLEIQEIEEVLATLRARLRP